MAHAESAVTIDRPIKEVFGFILDGVNNILWRDSVREVRLTTGWLQGLGAVYRQRDKGPFGLSIKTDYTIVECEPSRTIRFQVIAGPARPAGTYRFEEVGRSTRVTFALDLQPRGLARFMDKKITKTMESEVTMLKNLKRHLEGRNE